MVKLSFILNSDILKVLVNLSFFFILFFSLNFGLSKILGEFYFSAEGGNSGAQINYLLKQRNSIVIFGSSRAMHHYIPEIISEETGYSTYNAGDDGKNSTYQLGLLDMLLTKYKPKVIIYEIGDYTANLDVGTVDLYPYYYHYPQIEDILDKRDRYAKYKFKFYLYAYNQKIFTILHDELIHSHANKTGYHPLSGTIRQEEINEYYKNYEKTAEPVLDSTAIDGFIEFIELCKKNNIKLILVYSPKMFDSHFKYLALVDSLASRYQIPYLNYVNDPHFIRQKELFHDKEHLNNNGAKLFSEELGNDLHEYLLSAKNPNIGK